jgi:hypothetical protein
MFVDSLWWKIFVIFKKKNIYKNKKKILLK